MPKGDKPRRASRHVEPKEDPDERLRREPLAIAEGDYEGPDQRAHARSQAIAKRLASELPRLADIASVPPEQRDRLAWAVLNVVLDAWQNNDTHEATSKLPSNNAALSRVLEASRATKRALADLDQRYREALWRPIADIEGGIDRLFEWVLGEAERVQPQAHRRGRRIGTIANSVFQIFVRDLLRAARACGGRLTFNQNDGTGTLKEAIEALSPCLPEGCVPRALPRSTIQRIKTKTKSAKRR